MNTVLVENYNPSWPKEFILLKNTFEVILKDNNVIIEHVGSTSVPGLAAKPILDIDIIMDNEDELDDIIQKLESVGYKHLGDLGITGRQAFRRLCNNAPIYNSNTYTFTHNLYVCQKDILALKNHLLFRDYLKRDKDALNEYASLKKELAIKYPNDIDSYCEAKTDFITNILKKSGLQENDINDITNQNTLD